MIHYFGGLQMKNIDKKIRQFHKRFKISRVPSCEEVKTILEKLGYYVIPYTDEERLRYGDDIHPAYTFEYNESKFVYYDSTLCDTDIVIALTHEIAHIYLSHSHRTNSPFDTSTYKDYEANVFVYKLFTYKQNLIKNIIFIISLIICFSNLGYSSFLMRNDIQNPSNQKTDVITQSNYVITSSGKKYHQPHCYYVKYKTNTITVTEFEAEQFGKEPCDVCIDINY